MDQGVPHSETGGQPTRMSLDLHYEKHSKYRSQRPDRVTRFQTCQSAGPEEPDDREAWSPVKAPCTIGTKTL